MENRKRIAQTFHTDPVNLITLNQIHSTKLWWWMKTGQPQLFAKPMHSLPPFLINY